MTMPNDTTRRRGPDPVQDRRRVAMSSRSRWSVQTTLGHGCGAVMRPEGLTEYRTQVLVARDPRVVRIEEQVGPIRCVDAAGKGFVHFLDMRVTYRDGARLGISVKAEARAHREDFRARMAEVAAAAVPTLIDRLVVVTERHHDEDALHDAFLVHGCRRPDPDADAAVAPLVDAIGGPVSIADLAAPAGLGGRGLRAVVRLIGRGVLERAGTGRIGPSTLVRKAASS